MKYRLHGFDVVVHQIYVETILGECLEVNKVPINFIVRRDDFKQETNKFIDVMNLECFIAGLVDGEGLTFGGLEADCDGGCFVAGRNQFKFVQVGDMFAEWQVRFKEEFHDSPFLSLVVGRDWELITLK